jgi:hypothetical protein
MILKPRFHRGFSIVADNDRKRDDKKTLQTFQGKLCEFQKTAINGNWWRQHFATLSQRESLILMFLSWYNLRFH